MLGIKYAGTITKVMKFIVVVNLLFYHVIDLGGAMALISCGASCCGFYLHLTNSRPGFKLGIKWGFTTTKDFGRLSPYSS